jgi:hypothetical protein
MPNENGYNNHQNSYDQSFVQESNNAQTDSSGDQNNGQSDKKVQKTLILVSHCLFHTLITLLL